MNYRDKKINQNLKKTPSSSSLFSIHSNASSANSVKIIVSDAKCVLEKRVSDVQSKLLQTRDDIRNDNMNKNPADYDYDTENLRKQLELAKLIQSLSSAASSVKQLEEYLDDEDGDDNDGII